MTFQLPKRIALVAVLVLSLHCTASAQDLPLPAGLPVPQDPIMVQPPISVPEIPAPAPAKAQKELERSDYKDDWRQAGNGTGRLDDRLRSHIVRLNEDGSLVGKVSLIETVTGDLAPVQQARVRFVRKGKLKETVEVINGVFTARTLEPGIYSVIAAGPGGFLAWSANIQPKLSEIAKMPKWKRASFLRQDVKGELKLEAAAVPPSNFTPLKELLSEYLPSEGSTLYVDGPDIPEGMDEAPPASARIGTTLKHHQVRLTKDGRLLGRIRRLQPDTGRDLQIIDLNVFAIRNDTVLSQETVAPNGTFAFDDLRPGVYSLVAAGQDGFLAFSIDVLNPPQTEASVPVEGAVTTAKHRIDKLQIALALDMALVPPEDLNPSNLADFTDNFVGNNGATGPIAGTGPAPGGITSGAPGGAPTGPAGGISGGGIGGGGVPAATGGGLGGILTTAAVGVGIAAVVDDDSGVNSPSSPGTGSDEQ